MKILAVILIGLTLANCKKQQPINNNNNITNNTQSIEYEWKFQESLQVIRDVNNDTLIGTTALASVFISYDHKLSNGKYYQSLANFNNYVEAGVYNTDTLSYGNTKYGISLNNVGQLVLERRISTNNNTYHNQQIKFNKK